MPQPLANLAGNHYKKPVLTKPTKTRDMMTERPKTPTYVAFYILFSPDTWRLVMGFVAAVLLVPRIAPPELSTTGRIMLYVMVAAIGWAATAKPAAWVTGLVKKLFLGNKRP
jgi:hypothetical protein